MELQLIRNATLRLNYAGHLILIDPFFAPRHSREPFVGKERNPTAELPIPTEAIMEDIELIIVSHLHSDHFDPLAQEMLPKNLPLICQPGDEETIREKGFEDVSPLEDILTWHNISLTRTEGRHGTGKWLERLGNVMGFVIRTEGEPTVYWAGDTIWYEPVEAVIETQNPDIIITHSSGALFEENSPIVMNAEQTIKLCKKATEAKVIAVHLESLDHGTVTRQDLRRAASQANISEEQLLIPMDGDILKF